MEVMQKVLGHSGNTYVIIAICSKCGKELMRSNKILGKKTLKQFWHKAVLEAPLAIKCECFKNFNDSLRYLSYKIEKTDAKGNVKIYTPKELGLK